MLGNDAGDIRSPNEVSRRRTSRVQRAQADLDELPRVTPKGFRHTHATLLLELGEHPKVVQERLGHSTITSGPDSLHREYARRNGACCHCVTRCKGVQGEERS